MKQVCAGCGALWQEGQGFIQEHYPLCANQRHSWNFVIGVPDGWQGPRRLPCPPYQFVCPICKTVMYSRLGGRKTCDTTACRATWRMEISKPTIRLKPKRWNFICMEGESPTVDVVIDNPYGIAFAWQAISLFPNISVWPTSGIAPSVVTVQMHTEGVSPGTHFCWEAVRIFLQDDPDAAERARQCIAQTRPPLFVPQPE